MHTAIVMRPLLQSPLRTSRCLQQLRYAHKPTSTLPRPRSKPTQIRIPSNPPHSSSPAGPPPPPPPPPPQKLFDRIGRARKLPFILLSAATFITSFYIASVYTSYRTYLSTHDASTTHASVPADVTDRWDAEALTFDRDVEPMEAYTGMNWLRWWLIRRVSGHVLEASVGTGRNIKWYPVSRVASVTMVDQSLPMIQVAREKWRSTHPRALDKVVFRHQDVVADVVIPAGAEEGFDYVVQTMGLCSTPRPVEMLRSLAGMAKPEGRILLLEHGRSYYDWLNGVLDRGAGAHADKYGCWWNKDVGEILEASGVEVVKVRRFHFGTTWWIEVRPGREMREERENKRLERERLFYEEQERKKIADEAGERMKMESKSWWSWNAKE